MPSTKDKKKMKNPIAILALIVLITSAAWAEGNSFNFQGRLNDGNNPANGRYDLTFRLFDAIVGGNPLGQLVSKPNTVLINGVFSVTLDMGPGFSNPNNTFIEISVKPAGSPNAYTILGPRQQLTVVPFAVRAQTATNADNAANATNPQNAINATNADNATNATNSLSLGGAPASSYVRLGIGPIFPLNVGTLTLTGDSITDGNIRQSRAYGGAAKAMIYVRQDAVIFRCYNGIANLSTGNCGFVITRGGFAGTYSIDFGFPVDDRFICVTAADPTGSSFNTHVNASFRSGVNPNSVVVQTAITNITTNGDDADFMIIVY